VVVVVVVAATQDHCPINPWHCMLELSTYRPSNWVEPI
jgi:hypothetical protein